MLYGKWCLWMSSSPQRGTVGVSTTRSGRRLVFSTGLVAYSAPASQTDRASLPTSQEETDVELFPTAAVDAFVAPAAQRTRQLVV